MSEISKEELEMIAKTAIKVFIGIGVCLIIFLFFILFSAKS